MIVGLLGRIVAPWQQEDTDRRYMMAWKPQWISEADKNIRKYATASLRARHATNAGHAMAKLWPSTHHSSFILHRTI